MKPISGIDVYQDCADLTGRQLKNNSLGIIGRPNSNSISFFQTGCHETPGALVYLCLQLVVGVTDLLVMHNQRLIIRVLLYNFIEHFTNRQAQNRFVAGTAGVALSVLCHISIPVNPNVSNAFKSGPNTQTD